MEKVALALGGNIGNVKDTFNKAIAKLANGGVCDIRKSSLITTAPVDCIPGTKEFTNAAITGVWNGSLVELFQLCQEIEEKLGRSNNHLRGESRTIDIDIILFGNLIHKDNQLEIPHKEAKNRYFVLFPLSEIAGDWTFPKNGVSVRELMNDLMGSKDKKTNKET